MLADILAARDGGRTNQAAARSVATVCPECSLALTPQDDGCMVGHRAGCPFAVPGYCEFCPGNGGWCPYCGGGPFLAPDAQPDTVPSRDTITCWRPR